MERCVKKVVQKRKKDLTGPTLLEMPVYPDAIHSFCRAKAWNTSPNLRRAWPNSTLRRRLGTNTT
jgi:hypothetical protein